MGKEQSKVPDKCIYHVGLQYITSLSPPGLLSVCVCMHSFERLMLSVTTHTVHIFCLLIKRDVVLQYVDFGYCCYCPIVQKCSDYVNAMGESNEGMPSSLVEKIPLCQQ